MELPVLSRIRKMEPSLATLLILMVGAIAVIGLVTAVTAPVSDLLGDSQWSVISVFHGLGATAFLLGATIAVYLAWRLYIGEIRAFRDLKWLAAFSTVMSAVTISFGNWIYIGYRAPGGPRAFFMNDMPAIHQVFFEFKEFIALFTLPMMLVGTFLLWKYGEDIVHDQELRAAASLPILLGWVYLVLAYVLGAAITKLAGV
ncbi:MAG TPA: hypothetical protein VI999_01125 [Thermoplasmata archaeon]|nr:hypothetical protein [Thermoplasmata archaeon]